MIYRLTPKSCLMYAGLRLAKTFVCCCPDELNKRLADSKIESVRHLLCSVRANSTFVVASSQSQRVAFIFFMTRSATMTFATRGGAHRYVAGSARKYKVIRKGYANPLMMFVLTEIGALKLLLCSVRVSKTFVAQCTRYLNVCLFCCIAIQKLLLANVR